ncbi:hypothetical protein VNO77_17524 [Canavalia gladiata]|uniref:Uncharacterized protein n=1 Tax=Canavalia gladiata TaxID=3824 RepID=A0AAN9LJ25_CANGL
MDKADGIIAKKIIGMDIGNDYHQSVMFISSCSEGVRSCSRLSAVKGRTYVIKSVSERPAEEDVSDWYPPTQNTNSFIHYSHHPKVPKMSLWLSNLVRLYFTTPWPILTYAATWITLLTLTVAVASFSPQVAFVSAISPSSSFSQKCNTDGSIRMPLDVPGDILCFPAHTFVKSKIDLIVPPVFAAAIVAASACVVRAVGLWEHDQTSSDF